jgi:hypothetical protein
MWQQQARQPRSQEFDHQLSTLNPQLLPGLSCLLLAAFASLQAQKTNMVSIDR